MFARHKLLGSVFIPLFLGLFCFTFAPAARAGNWNEETKLIFNAPVEIPGRVLLPGTYWFQLLDSSSNRNVVQIFNKNETRLIDTVMTVPAYRLRPTGHTVVTFAERPVDNPEAIRTWFYPGMNYGQRFIYPHTNSELAMKDSSKMTSHG